MSSAIQSVNDILLELKPTKLVTLNYSLREPIYVLSGGKINIDDYTWSKKDDVHKRIREDKTISHLIYRMPTESPKIDNAAYNFLYGHNDLVKELTNFGEVKKVRDQKGTVFVILKQLEVK